MTRARALIPFIALLGVGLAGCGDDDDAGEDGAIAAYCDGVAAAEARGAEVFADIDESDGEALAAAEAEVLAFVRDQALAPEDLPEEIRADAQAFLAGFEARVEDGVEPTAEQEAAEQRLLAWEEDHCTGE